MKKILLLTALLILIGAGCASASQQKPVAPSPATTSTPTVIKKPAMENKNPVYDFCEKNNNEIIIRFDQETQSSKAYCRFPDTSECAAEEYFAGNCAPGKGSKIFAQEIKIAPLPAQQDAAYPPEIFTSQPEMSQPEDTGNPDWLDIVKNFILSQPAESPRAHLDRCYYSGSVVYLKASGCAGCYDSLYDRDGKIICYPNHDFSDSCPSFSAAAANCARVWTDKR